MMCSSSKKCKFCEKEFIPVPKSSKFCSADCKRLDFNREQKRRREAKLAHTIRRLNCITCGTPFESRRSNAIACSRKCVQDYNNLKVREERREENNRLYEGIVDIPTCKLCGWKSRSLQQHLTTHRLTVQQYRDQYNAQDDEIFHHTYMAEKSERVSGERNPGYQHGGTMSSFSPKYFRYQDLPEEAKQEAIKQQIIKANETKDLNAGYNTRVDFYVERLGMDEEAAVEALSKRQTTFSLEICIDKYGEALGQEIWKHRQVKWRRTLDSLPDEEKQRILQKIAQNLAGSRGGVSDISQQLFEALNVPDALYGKNELAVCTPDGRLYRVDFTLGNKIIEFNGDYWHANPVIERYADPSTMIKFPGNIVRTADEIRAKDARRVADLTAMGYEVMVVWEADYRKNKQQVIRECLDFLEAK